MPSSVVVKSPSPNNDLIHVLTQTVDSEGNAVGAPQLVSVLDDGGEWTGRIGPNTVVIQVAVPRNAIPVATHAEPDTGETEQVPDVIGGGDPTQPKPVAS